MGLEISSEAISRALLLPLARRALRRGVPEGVEARTTSTSAKTAGPAASVMLLSYS